MTRPGKIPSQADALTTRPASRSTATTTATTDDNYINNNDDDEDVNDDLRIWARMHHKVVGNFGSEADVRSLCYRR